MLCKYKNILGEVDKGIHSYKIFNLAIFDILFTILGAYIIKIFIPKYNLFLILIVLFLIGIILHRLFCVKTTIDKFIFN